MTASPRALGIGGSAFRNAAGTVRHGAPSMHPSTTSKWRCGMALRPESPDSPIVSPRDTVSPTATSAPPVVRWM